MTFRQQRREQYVILHIYAILLSLIVAPAIWRSPWMLLVVWAGWEAILWAMFQHKCWRQDTDLDAKVPMDAEGRPLE